MAELGVQGTLATLHPAIGWDATVLQTRTPKELDFYPRGAGVTLLPSVFWTGRPQIGQHPDGSVAIVYPALTPLPILRQAPGDHGNPLCALLGRTRAGKAVQHSVTPLGRMLLDSTAASSGWHPPATDETDPVTA